MPPKPKTETLICQNGNHKWTRNKARGRKPVWCPEHAPVVKTYQGDSETLQCKNGGHDWTRERKRGRKPPYCPEHAPKPVEPGETPVHIGTTVPEHRLITPEVEDLLGTSAQHIGHEGNRTAELRGQMRYIIGTIRSGKREQEDVDLMMKRHRDILNEHRRLSRPYIAPSIEDIEDEAIAA